MKKKIEKIERILAVVVVAAIFLISTMFITPISACEHGACPWGISQCLHLEGRFQEGDRFFDRIPFFLYYISKVVIETTDKFEELFPLGKKMLAYLKSIIIKSYRTLTIYA